jgi:hypothetical protein
VRAQKRTKMFRTRNRRDIAKRRKRKASKGPRLSSLLVTAVVDWLSIPSLVHREALASQGLG